MERNLPRQIAARYWNSFISANASRCCKRSLGVRPSRSVSFLQVIISKGMLIKRQAHCEHTSRMTHWLFQAMYTTTFEKSAFTCFVVDWKIQTFLELQFGIRQQELASW